MTSRLALLVCAGAALTLTACAAQHHAPRRVLWNPPVRMLLRYDFNHDGSVSRAEMERGLHADFARDDANHDGRLDEDEVRAVNQRRWAAAASTSSPLVDWNHDGYVDFDEFSGTARSLFDQLDINNDNVLSPGELKAGKTAPLPQKKRTKGRFPGGDRGGERPGGDGDGD